MLGSTMQGQGHLATPFIPTTSWNIDFILHDRYLDCQMYIFNLKNKELKILFVRLVQNFIDPHGRYLSFSGHPTWKTYQGISSVLSIAFFFFFLLLFIYFFHKDTSVESTLLMLHVLAYAFCKPITFYMVLPTAFYGLLLCINYDDK